MTNAPTITKKPSNSLRREKENLPKIKGAEKIEGDVRARIKEKEKEKTTTKTKTTKIKASLHLPKEASPQAD